MNRAFLSTFAELAARYGIYLVAGTSMAPAQHGGTEHEVALLGDPERPPGASVYVAGTPDVYNAAYIWAPDGRLLGCSRKVNLTPRARPHGLDLIPGILGPRDVPTFDTPAGILGVAISLDAFVLSYVRYLNDRGVQLFLQPEANPGP